MLDQKTSVSLFDDMVGFFVCVCLFFLSVEHIILILHDHLFKPLNFLCFLACVFVIFVIYTVPVLSHVILKLIANHS